MLFNQNKWSTCSMCRQIMYAGREHTCPERPVRETLVNMNERINNEIEYFDIELENFWTQKDILFLEYLAKTGQI